MTEASSKTYDGRAGVERVLELLLTDDARGPARRWAPAREFLALANGLFENPAALPRRTGRLVRELGRIAVGRSEITPAEKDLRFRDDAWTGNPFFRALMQTHQAWEREVNALIDDADLAWEHERRLRFLAVNLFDLIAPSNVPQLNPEVIKATIDEGGGNIWRGLRRFVRDMSSPPRLPAMVDTERFEVGEDLALTPGAVIHQTELVELIQYEPTTDEVHGTPVLLVPPMINKYYIADIAPGRSMLEYFVSQGFPSFTISWRNPPPDLADLGIDDYVRAVLDSMEVVAEVTGAPAAHVLGLCAGGILSAIAAGHLAATGESDRMRTLSLAVTVLDQERAGTIGSMLDRTTAALSVAESARKGYVDGSTLAGVFAWLRPTDLVWRYWINNYLLGKKPPAFDVLYWNQDSTRLPARLHEDFVRMSLTNALTRPGKLEVLGTPIDLSKVSNDLYAVAGINDHISPWEDCYLSSRLFGAEATFVLSTAGHIVSLVNPPDNPKARFLTAPADVDDPQAWKDAATGESGSWWEHWTSWLAERSGDRAPAPTGLGSDAHPPIRDAPGEYVHEA